MKITLPLSLKCGCRLFENGLSWAFDRCPLHTTAQKLLDTLIMALPYVETALEDQGYKPGIVNQKVKQIRATIAEAEGGR